VAQAGGAALALRRQPDPNRLNIVVPDPNSVETFKPSVDYTWKNDNLRASLFPHRDSAFREFLRKEKKLDLQKEKSTGFPIDLLTEIGEKILAERAGLDLELKQHKQERLKAEADLRTTQTERKKYLSRPEVRGPERQKRQLEAQEKSLAAKVQAQEARIAVLEEKGDKLNLSEQSELDKRHEMLTKIQEELTETTQLLEEVNGMLEPTLAPLREAETRLKGEIEAHRKQEKILGPKFKRVSGGVNTKTKQADRDTAVNWLLEEYVQRINSLDHDELLGLVLDRFDADKDFTKYPKQERYLIIHFSGMRYATAHNSRHTKGAGDPRVV
jgi:hypothetical protein